MGILFVVIYLVVNLKLCTNLGNFKRIQFYDLFNLKLFFLNVCIECNYNLDLCSRQYALVSEHKYDSVTLSVCLGRQVGC